MNKQFSFLICIALSVVIGTADESKATKERSTLSSLKLIASFMDVLGTDEGTGKMYFISKEEDQKTFDGSVAACKKLGLKIISFETKAEHDDFLRLYEKKNFKHSAYVGITRGNNNTWTRAGNTEALDFPLKFFRGEPNNVSDNENCIHVNWWYGQGAGFNDIPCSELVRFICVKS